MQSTYESLVSHSRQPQRTAGGRPLTVGRALGAVWQFIQSLGQRKAAADILELADSLQATRPEMAAQMRRAVARAWD